MEKNNKGNIVVETIKIALMLLMSTIGVLVLFGLLLNQLEIWNQTNMYRAFGWNGIVLTGWIGTPIHEFSHWIMCKLFGVSVYKVALFRPFAGRIDGVLGYVQYGRNPHNLWQTFGTFFIGIAPMVIGTIIILLAFRLLLPEPFQELKTKMGDSLKDENIKIGTIFSLLGQTIWCLVKQLFSSRGWGILRYFIFILFMFGISSHLTMSPADLQGAIPGFLLLVVLYIIMAFIVALSKQDIYVACIRSALTISAFFIMAVLFAGLSLAISCGFAMLFR